MAEKRDNYRHRKRLKVRFGVDAPGTAGFTEDLSNYGLFVKSGLVLGPGRILVVEVVLDDERVVRMRAKVQWAKRVPPALLRTCKGGMGLSILEIQEGAAEYRDLCDELRRIKEERESVVSRTTVTVNQ